MTAPAPLRGGIIAAGEGSRLRASGFAMPKPLVTVAGVPLIESVITNFLAVGVTSLVIIVNDDGRACVVDGLDRLRDGAPRLACKAGAEQRIHDRRGGGPRQLSRLARRCALPLAVVAGAPLGAAQLQRGRTGEALQVGARVAR